MDSFLKKVELIIRDKRAQLPTLPVVVDSMLKIARDESASAADLANAISRDQAIVNKTLKLANSAYYGFIRSIDTVSHAIALIGFNEVISLILGMSVFSAFRLKGGGRFFDIRDLWLHSIACAFMAKKIAKKTGPGGDTPIFLCGLIHDMGKVFLSAYFPDEYSQVLEASENTQVPLFRKEEEILGLNHSTVAGLLMERWNLPDNLRLPCRFHHNSSACPAESRSQATIIEIANFLCHKADIGYSGNSSMEMPEVLIQKMGISDNDMDSFLKELQEERAEIEEFLGIMS